jgi:dTDP-4-amino-4,6-dideoxygalactose transaminase
VNPWLLVIDEWASKGVIPLCKSSTSANVRLLRMPLLARSRGHRDRLVALLNLGGLGASPMYMTSLPKVAGVPQSVLAQGPFPKADRLAERLFTLPTHASVNDRHVAIVDRCIQRLT